MNTTNLRQLRSHLAKLAKTQPELFNMHWFAHRTTCGTAHCIGGWAAELAKKAGRSEKDYGHNSARLAESWLGLSEQQASWLFYPNRSDGGITLSQKWKSPYDTTPQEALRVLDHLIKTGEVDWTKAAPFTLPST